MKSLTTFCFTLLQVLTCITSAETANPLAKFEPADGKCYQGVCLTGFWSEKETRENLQAWQDKVSDMPVVLHSWFAHCRENGKWRTWYWMNDTPDGRKVCGTAKSYAQTSRNLGMTPLIAWSWMDWHDKKTSPSLQDVVTGKYDWYFDDWIKGVKEFGDPIFIRLSHEMDGDWYPYSEGWKDNPTRNTAADFIAYYRYVVDRFNKAGVKNVAWVWCVNGDRSGGKDWPDYYPGDQYVDWLGIDPYSSRNPREMIEPLLTMYPNKPLMIPEGGTGPSQTKWNNNFTSNEAWINELFDVIAENPRVKALCWFEFGSEWKLANDPKQLKAYQARITDKRFDISAVKRN
ncbi:MAG: glycoside hydrolase family 26 protein [Phycisphaeraceae bacterium JB051]